MNLSESLEIVKTLIGVNTLTEVDNSVYLAHNALWYELGKEYGSKGEKFIMFNPYRTSIDNMRNTAVKIALEQQCDYLMFIDDDMILSPNTYKSLREADKDIVMALTYIRGYPYDPMHFIDSKSKEGDVKFLQTDKDFESRIDENGLVECDAIGNACVLYKTWIFNKFDPPYFVTLPKCTEDVYFCIKAKNTLGRQGVKIFVDTKVPTGHLGDKEVFHHDTIKKQREAFEVQYGKPEPSEFIARGNKYAEMVESL